MKLSYHFILKIPFHLKIKCNKGLHLSKKLLKLNSVESYCTLQFNLTVHDLFLSSMIDQDEEVSSIVRKYEKELGELQNVVREKQRFIDRIQSDKL